MSFSVTILAEWREGLKTMLDMGGRRRRLLYAFASATIRFASVLIRSAALLRRAAAAIIGQCAAARSALADPDRPIKS
jgi:hypothetical protein